MACKTINHRGYVMAIRKFNIPITSVVLIAVVSFLFAALASAREPKQVSGKKGGAAVARSTEVGTGWSTKENPEEAVREALTMALEGKKNRMPDFAIIFASSGSDMKAIHSQAKKTFGKKTKIYGGTSDSRGVMTNRGFAKATVRGYEYAGMEGKRSLAVMTVTSNEIAFGVGSANIENYPSIQEAAKAAVSRAIKNAGKTMKEPPKAVLLTPTKPAEEEVVEGVESVVGKKTLILGGTAGGPSLAVFGENAVYEKGVSLAVIYTKLKVGYMFEGGFDVREPTSGIVTRTDGQAIVEIDKRPAVDVYDEWLGGQIGRMHRDGAPSDEVKELLTLHPLYRKYAAPDGKVYALFSHPWPKDNTLKDRCILTSTKIKVGERIHLSRGSWEILLNRIGNLPRNAKINGKIHQDAKPILAIGYICAGVMGTIPEPERVKMPMLINYANNDAPFIAPFTWGEQGHFSGIGNRHGNLLTGFLVIGD